MPGGRGEASESARPEPGWLAGQTSQGPKPHERLVLLLWGVSRNGCKGRGTHRKFKSHFGKTFWKRSHFDQVVQGKWTVDREGCFGQRDPQRGGGPEVGGSLFPWSWFEMTRVQGLSKGWRRGGAWGPLANAEALP